MVENPDKVRAGLEGFISDTAADEVMIISPAFDHRAHLHSRDIIAGLEIDRPPPPPEQARFTAAR